MVDICLARRLVLTLTLIVLTATAFASTPSAADQQRIRKLQLALLAPCCYSEPVVRHNSEVAMKMRAEIVAAVAAGKSDREILDGYKQQYGSNVLAEPEGAKWWWEHVVPLAVLAFGALVVVLVIRRWIRTRPPATPAAVLAPLPDDLDD